MESWRLELLSEYREARERSNINPAGEASGRTYLPIPDALREIATFPAGMEGFVELFTATLAASPTKVRRGERIVGDYYFLIPYELIEPPFPWSSGVQISVPSGHTVGNISEALRLGWPGIRRRVTDALDAFESGTPVEAAPRIAYLKSLLEILDVIEYRILAYRDAARGRSIEARAEGDDMGAEEASDVAIRLTKLIDHPPETFHEAVQWYWMYVTFERVTSAGMGGIKLDSVLAPYLEADLAAGRIDEDSARDLLIELFLKEGLFYCIGGTKADGTDATSRLSWLALEAYDSIGGPSNLNVRWHPDIDPEFFSYAVEVLLRHGNGVPNLVNDLTIVPSLTAYGIPLALAREYTFAGCFWFVLAGKEYPYHDMEAIAAAEILVETIESCRNDPPEDFNELLSRFFDLQEERIDTFQHTLEELEETNPLGMPEPILSMVTDGTVERGLDITQWSEYRMTTVLYVGLATVVDSLNAMRTLIFYKATLTWKELFAAVDSDFDGVEGERIRRQLLSVPKFGNDDPDTDRLANRCVREFSDQLADRKNHHGFAFRPAFYSWNRHIYDGSRLPATPDGRHAGDPVSQGVNPAQGRAEKGVTASINSVSELGLRAHAGAPIHLQVTGIHPERDHRPMKDLFITAFKRGIPQIIFNVTDKKTLVEACEHPDRHWDLVVRVTGYSARFVQCSPAIQADIISRTEFTA